jgi:hypothetical protein
MVIEQLVTRRRGDTAVLSIRGPTDHLRFALFRLAHLDGVCKCPNN